MNGTCLNWLVELKRANKAFRFHQADIELSFHVVKEVEMTTVDLLFHTEQVRVCRSISELAIVRQLIVTWAPS